MRPATRVPLEGVEVKAECPELGGGTTVKSDKKGRWVVGGVVAGRWNLDLAAEGYETKKVTVDLDKVLAADPGNNQVRAIAAQAALEGKMVDRARQLLATEAKADFRRVIELSPRGEMADMSRKALDSLK